MEESKRIAEVKRIWRGQTHQLHSLFLGGLAERWRLVALAIERSKLLLYERQPRDLPSDLVDPAP
jgi:hypothetical protein